MALLYVFMALLILSSFIPLSYSEDIRGSHHDSKIHMQIQGDTTSGKITHKDVQYSWDDIKLIYKNQKLYIFDNDIKILAKQVADYKYLIIAKLADDDGVRLRFLSDVSEPAKNTAQRNLLDEMNQKTLESVKSEHDMTFKEKQLLEKEKKTAEAKKISDDRLERIAEQNTKNMNGKTSHGIMEDWKES